jgi:PAS domain S-box-containing protein
VPDSLTDLVGVQIDAEDFLAAVLDMAAQPIWVVDPHDVIRFANPAAIAALGYSAADELLGHRSHETIHYKHLDGTPYPADDCQMLLPRSTGESVSSDLDWFCRRDGSMFPVSYVSAPIDMPDGRGAVVAFADIEDRLRAERVLREHDAVLATQQTSLRRVAGLVAGGAASADVFTAITRETAELLGTTMVHVWRFESDGTATVLGAWRERRQPSEIGTVWPYCDPAVGRLVQEMEAGRAVRIEDFSKIGGPVGDAGRAMGITSMAAAPIVVNGELWGLMAAAMTDHGPLPDHVEDRLAEFTDLVAAAISNSESRGQLARLADEQAALRRVATLVARESPPAEIFAAVAEEVAVLLGVEDTTIFRYEDDWTATVVADRAGDRAAPLAIGSRLSLEGESATALVRRTARPARVDDFSNATGPLADYTRDAGIGSSVASPIVVDGRLWGAVVAATRKREALPRTTEARIGQFTELVAAAIANVQARAEIARLADEQAALRRVATVVARGASQAEVFSAIAEECGGLFGIQEFGFVRYEADGESLVLASSGAFREAFAPGTRRPLGGDNATSRVYSTREPVRIDDYSDSATGAIAEAARSIGVGSVVATPVIVEGRLWGAMVIGSAGAEPLPPDTEVRLAQFTELMATAIANTESRARAELLADEQAALRRVATLVARETPPDDVFAAVAREVGEVLGVDATHLGRYDADGTVVSVAQWGRFPGVPIGARFPLEGDSVSARVLRTGRSARMDSYEDAPGVIAATIRQIGIRFSIGVPLSVEGRLWGVMIATSKDAPFPVETESRLQNFTELVATALSNASAHEKVRVLADEQAGLRRVATLVAQGAPPAAVFEAVTGEVAQLLDASTVTLGRYEEDMVTVVAQHGDDFVGAGDRLPLGGRNVASIVRRTGRTARLDDVAQATGAIGDRVRRAAARSAVASPVVVDGRTWGVLAAIWMDRGPPPEDTEERLDRFAELLDTAIANADSRDQLAASRARVLAAGDDARRRVVRDLHDGAQQRLVHTIITLKLAQRALHDDPGSADARLVEALDNAERATAEVRELAHGILPAVLVHSGLYAGVDAFVSRLDLPVDVEVLTERLPADIEASAYFIVAEALTNVVKHAHASSAKVKAWVEDGALHVDVVDDGAGGADPSGHGLIGLSDRATALGGSLAVVAPPSGGTAVSATFPL